MLRKSTYALSLLRKYGLRKCIALGYVFLFKKNKEKSQSEKFFVLSGLIGALDLHPQDISENSSLLAKYSHGSLANIRTVLWFIPRFEHVLYGGIFTIFRFADFFRTQGIQSRFVVYDDPLSSSKKIRESIQLGFPELAESCEILSYTGNVNDLPESDIAIATFWTSAFLLLRFRKTKMKYYFIQDYEPLFYSAGTEYALAEMTYRFGFKGIVNTPGLEAYLKKHHTLDTCAFRPSIDRALYHISREELERKHLESETITIVTYGRPNHPRNAFELTIETLKKVKALHGSKVNIISVGAEWSPSTYGVEGIITNLGRLNSLDEVAALYRKAHIGLVFMFTPHPSYQPFEYAASGVNIVMNCNSATSWLLQHEDNALLSEPTPHLLATQISRLVSSPELRLQLASHALETVSVGNWESECSKILDFIRTN